MYHYYSPCREDACDLLRGSTGIEHNFETYLQQAKELYNITIISEQKAVLIFTNISGKHQNICIRRNLLLDPFSDVPIKSIGWEWGFLIQSSMSYFHKISSYTSNLSY